MLSTVLELVGLAAIAAGGALVAPWLGLMLGGLAVLLVGLSLEG